MIAAWGWPQLTILGLYVFILVLTAYFHCMGHARKAKPYNFYETAFGIGTTAWIFYMGGFWG